MRVLVYPHAMDIGGSPLNAIALAGAVRELGHEVVVISEPGPLVERVLAMELDHIQIPAGRRRPSPATAAQLVKVAIERRIDVVHGYEWPPVVEARFGPGLVRRTAVVGTVMSMSVVPFFPRTVSLVVGTELIREAAIAAGHRNVVVIEPPVDTDADNPSFDAGDFRARHAIGPDEVLIAMVCRLVPELKLEGLLMACDAVGELAKRGRPARLVIAGDGRARDEVAQRAAMANAAAGRCVVTMAGEVSDPRHAYAAADVMVGQGGSALRGMAFGKPLVVVGEEGFSELLTPESAPLFLRQGWYGLGTGSRGTGAPALRHALERLLGSAQVRRQLGEFARELVVERFGLRHAAQVLASEYAYAMSGSGSAAESAIDLSRCAAGVLTAKVTRKYERWRGAVSVDDANRRPVTLSPADALRR